MPTITQPPHFYKLTSKLKNSNQPPKKAIADSITEADLIRQNIPHLLYVFFIGSTLVCILNCVYKYQLNSVKQSTSFNSEVKQELITNSLCSFFVPNMSWGVFSMWCCKELLNNITLLKTLKPPVKVEVENSTTSASQVQP